MKAKTKRKSPKSYLLQVQVYSIRIYPGQSGNPQDNLHGNSLGYLILKGVGAFPFTIQFLPDGSEIPKTDYNPDTKTVDMCMNWSQLDELLTLLKTADSVQAIYDEQTGYSDVEGQYVRPNKKRKNR